ncbi:MAG: hypothetical protein HY870_00985 [Chloroflexi bacterium]|nr:hypothetical protein [Chloroflexota bacterium]
MLSRFGKQFDLNLVVVLLIVVIAALPFLTRPGLPRHTDLELHVYRAAEYADVWRDGVLYPRWAPNFYYGYGYPIFNYYAPFTYALSSLYDLIPGVDIVLAVKGMIITAFLLTAYGAYFFARRHFGSTAGVIAAAAFVLSPYVLFIDPLMRGDLAEFLALSLLPWIFLVFDRPRFSIAQPLVLGVFILSHNLLAIMGVVLLGLYLLWRGLTLDGIRRWRGDFVSIGLALAITALFWLPFIFERGAVRLNVAGPGHFDYHNHFIALSMLLSPSPALDFGATAPKYVYNLGLVQWLLFVPALIIGIVRRKEMAGKIALFFIVVSAILAFLITPLSTFIWEAFPPAAIVQFPWRLLGPVAFTLAIGVASLFSDAAHALPFTRHSSPVTRHSSLIILPALLIAALPTMYPPLWDVNFGDTSPHGSIDFELSGIALGTTSTGDFLPKPVGIEPGPNAALIDSYATLVNKFDQATLPDDATATVEAHTAIGDRFQIETPQAFQARVLTFLFPGWHAYRDGREVSIAPQDQSGLMLIDIPAGSHTLELSLQLTTPQLIGTIISIAALIALVGLSLKLRPHPASCILHPASRTAPILLAITLLFLITKITAIDRCDSCFRYTSPPGQVLGAQHKQIAHLGGHIDLLGYDISATEIQPGGVLPLTVYWKATALVPYNYQVFAHINAADGTVWGQSDKLNPGDFPSTRWPPDKYVWDDHKVQLKPDTPPGEYQLSVGLYLLEDGRRAPVFDDDGQIVADHVVLTTTIQVRQP